MRSHWIALSLLLVLSSCIVSRPDSTVRYTDSGHKRCTVAIAPLYDRSHCHLPWSISSELTGEVRQWLEKDGAVVLVKRQRTDPFFDQLKVDELFDWESERLMTLRDTDFVVLMELMRHREVPYRRQEIQPIYPYRGDAGTVLCMEMRVRIVDLRGDKPQLVLQQMIPSNHAIPRGLSLNEVDYVHVPWQSQSYLKTPMGKAHSRLARDVAKQVEGYVNYAQG